MLRNGTGTEDSMGEVRGCGFLLLIYLLAIPKFSRDLG